MKKILITTLVCLFVLVISSTAKAVVLNPGSSIDAVAETILSYAPTTTLLASIIGASWSHEEISGTFSQWVYRDDSDGNLIFTYQIANDDDSDTGLTALTVRNYKNFSTYVAYESTSVPPLTFDRSSGTGSTVGFRFGFENIEQEDESALVWIKTNTPYYGPGEVSIINGGSVNVSSYGPAVPEPTSMLLFGMGILGLFGFKKKVLV